MLDWGEFPTFDRSWRISSMPRLLAPSISSTSTSFAAGDLLTDVTLTAGRGGRALHAIERLGQNSRRRRLADATGAGEQIGVPDTIGRDRIAEGLGDRPLPDQVGEGLRTIATGDDDVFVPARRAALRRSPGRAASAGSWAVISGWSAIVSPPRVTADVDGRDCRRQLAPHIMHGWAGTVLIGPAVGRMTSLRRPVPTSERAVRPRRSGIESKNRPPSDPRTRVPQLGLLRLRPDPVPGSPSQGPLGNRFSLRYAALYEVRLGASKGPSPARSRSDRVAALAARVRDRQDAATRRAGVVGRERTVQAARDVPSAKLTAGGGRDRVVRWGIAVERILAAGSRKPTAAESIAARE